MFKDKWLWITGASSGIGEALAKQFATHGAKLILSARREAELKQVKTACLQSGSPQVEVITMDLADPVSIERAFAEVTTRQLPVHYLFNNGGISQRSTFLETELATYRKLFEVNVFGQIALTKLVVPKMIEQGFGHLLVTTSVAGKIGVPFRTGYCATKHAMMGFFDALRSELATQKIKVTTIVPGYINTDISLNAVDGAGNTFAIRDTSISEGMNVDKAAQIIIRGTSKGKREIAVGEGMEMKALWLKRLFPGLLFKVAEKQVSRIAKSNQLKGYENQ